VHVNHYLNVESFYFPENLLKNARLKILKTKQLSYAINATIILKTMLALKKVF
jgi:predicted nucleotidyltransferase